ncbi:MAG: prephenate dehydrogenase/arogenate dehydrogenase family protein [Clostridiaceae bacterium]|nr:prephenate dehydrogenase/arogenate dehydrogenase family protein [Clostridiaceae bacterium]
MVKIGVIGLGIIGGSIVKAANKKGLAEYVVAYNRNPEVTEQALSEGTIHEAAYEINDSFRDCDIIFICVPVDIVPLCVQKLSAIVGSECVITDVGSTKVNVVNAVREMPLACTFIGGHPMAGSESTGYNAARHTLFENAYYVLTPFSDTNKAHLNRLIDFITALGGLPVIVEPTVHDYVTAAISHVPHVLASAIVNMIKKLDGDDKLMHTLAAGGFKDLTRIASSSPVIWESICLANSGNILKILSEFEEVIRSFKEILRKKDSGALTDFFGSAKEYRDSFSERKIGSLIKSYDIVVDVEDQPGVIASIAGELSSYGINIKNIGIINSREMEGGALEICFYDRESQQSSYRILKSLGYSVKIK